MQLEIVVLISVGISISMILLGVLMRKRPTPPPLPMRNQDMSNSSGRPAKKTTAQDIDRFLEEINRQRQSKKTGLPPVPPPVQRREPIVIQSKPEPKPASQPKKPKQRVPVVPAELVEEPLESAYATPVTPAASTSRTVPQASQAISMGIAGRPVSPTLIALNQLLKDKNNIRAAMILNEVLGKPKSQRHGQQR